jgi:hypothetical protein
MFDTKLQEYIETQNKAYYFHSEKNTNSKINDLNEQLEKKIQKFREQIKEEIKESVIFSKQYTDNLYKNVESFIPNISDDFFIGSIISVSVVCSQEEVDIPYLNNGIKVNSILNNIYMYEKENVQNQIFCWFFGKENNDCSYVKLPGVWKFRGVCGGFSNEVVGFKYYLAQRVQ